MQMSYLYASDFPFKNFCKLAQHAEAIRKHCLGKELWNVPIVDKSTDHDKPHFDLFLPGMNVKENVFFLQRASSKRHCVTRWCEQRGMNSNQQWQIVVKFNIPLFYRYFYNHLSNYTKTIIRFRLVNIGEYSHRLRLGEYSPLLYSQPRIMHFAYSDWFTQSWLSAHIPWFDLIW